MSFTEHGGSSPSPKKILRKRDAPKVINEVRKMLQAMKKPTTLPTNYERIGQVGRSLAFMDRDDLYEYTWKTFLKEHNYKLSTTDRTCWPLNAIVGSPGSGKTRFMAEVLRQPHPSVAEHFENYIYIHAIYNNGNEVLDLDRKAPSRCIALRLLFHYFIEGPPHVNLSRVLGDLYRLTQHLDETEFNIYQVLELIREDYLHVHQLDNDTTVHIAIGVDEYNKFLTGAPGANSSFEIRQIVASLASSRLRPPPNTRVYVLLAGTSGNAIVDAGQFSSWIVQPHRLAPLSESSALAIIAKYFNSTKVYNDACLRNLLLDIGGHPRLLEWLVREIHEYSSIDEVNWTDVRCVLAKRMAVMWDSAHKPALESVIKAMFRRDPLSSDEPLSSALTVDCLEQRELGLRVDQHGVPYWPHLCLQAWTEQLSSRNPHLHQVLRFTLHRSTDGDLFTWQHFKHFCAQYMALRVACIDKRVVFIHQLLQGAMMAQGLREDNTELSIPRHDQQCSRVFTSNKTFPVQRTLIDEQGKCINWCNTGRVVVNNEGAPFDLFCHLAVDGLKHGYFICGQTKYYKATQLTLELVQAEVKKVKTAMKKAHFEHWVLLLVTTGQCDFSEREVPAKCAVVSARQFEHFFTNLFAERVHFRCTDTVNINTDPVWVLRRLDGLGKETAENIMRLRQKKPFVDAGDACRRIGHTKWNRIKDVIVF